MHKTNFNFLIVGSSQAQLELGSYPIIQGPRIFRMIENRENRPNIQVSLREAFFGCAVSDKRFARPFLVVSVFSGGARSHPPNFLTIYTKRIHPNLPYCARKIDHFILWESHVQIMFQ